MSPAEKARLVTELSLAVRRLALAELHQRHPGESDEEIRLRLAARYLGRDLVRKVYGRDPGPE